MLLGSEVWGGYRYTLDTKRGFDIEPLTENDNEKHVNLSEQITKAKQSIVNTMKDAILKEIKSAIKKEIDTIKGGIRIEDELQSLIKRLQHAAIEWGVGNITVNMPSLKKKDSFNNYGSPNIRRRKKIESN